MKHWFLELDRILRGEKTQLDAPKREDIDIPVVGLSLVLILLGAFFGVCMGTFAALRGAFEQWLATTVKVPLLFLLTLIVTFPSLYVFNALVGSRFHVKAVWKILTASLGVTLAMLAAFGTIIAFFSVCTTNYPFMVLLNVAVFAVSGYLGLRFLLQTLHRMTVAGQIQRLSPPAPTAPQNSAGNDAGTSDSGAQPEQAAELTDFEPSGPLDRLKGHILGDHVKLVFRLWVVVFGLVGANGLGASAVHRESRPAIRVVPTAAIEFL